MYMALRDSDIALYDDADIGTSMALTPAVMELLAPLMSLYSTAALLR